LYSCHLAQRLQYNRVLWRACLSSLAILIILLFLALIPLSEHSAFPRGSSRRHARGWVAMLNLIAVIFSAVLFWSESMARPHDHGCSGGVF
jgi:hypothetical protein